MDFNILSIVTDVGVVFAIAIIAQQVKKLDPLNAWKRWYFAVPIGLGVVAGLAFGIAQQAGWWGIIRNGFVYGAAAAWVYDTYKRVKS